MAQQRTVTNGPWCFSTTTGDGIDGYEISAYRPKPGPIKPGHSAFLYGQLTGLVVKTREEATRLGLLYGYLTTYSRNSTEFVMSRAARRRGYKTTNWIYDYAMKRGPKRLIDHSHVLGLTE